MPPFRIFVCSPVDELEIYRAAVSDTAQAAESTGKFKFFFYENFENQVNNGKSVSQSIIENSGCEFDAILIFFRNRIGDGTLDELSYFEKEIFPKNKACQLWWSKIYCETCEPRVADLVKHLTNTYNTGLPALEGKLLNDSPEILTGRLTAKLIQAVR